MEKAITYAKNISNNKNIDLLSTAGQGSHVWK
jgi:hypothetical protein